MRNMRRVRVDRGNGLYQPQYSRPSKKKFQWRSLVRPFLYLAVAGLLLYAVSVSALFRIKTIKVKGLTTLSEDSIRKQTQAIISDSPLSENIIFVSSSRIESELKKTYYQVAQVKVDRSLFSTIIVTVTEQKPSILWKTGSNLVIFTEDGRAYAGEPNEELKKSLPTVVDLANLPVKTGERVVPQGFIRFVTALQEQLPNRGVKIEQMQIQDSTTELFVVTSAGYKLRFDTTRPISEQLIDLESVLDTVKKQNKKVTEYIDLRINGKVFYK